MQEVLKYLPEQMQLKIKEESTDKLDKIEEIRLRLERPIILKYSDSEKVIKYSVTTEEIISCLQAICENSIYTYQNQISEGFVTIKGGHRVRNKWFRRYGRWANNKYKSCI
jgi:stage III sporulation protein AA